LSSHFKLKHLSTNFVVFSSICRLLFYTSVTHLSPGLPFLITATLSPLQSSVTVSSYHSSYCHHDHVILPSSIINIIVEDDCLLLFIIALMTEAVSTSETSVNFYQSTRRNIPKDRHFHTCRRENLKSHLISSSSQKPSSVIFWLHQTSARLILHKMFFVVLKIVYFKRNEQLHTLSAIVNFQLNLESSKQIVWNSNFYPSQVQREVGNSGRSRTIQHLEVCSWFYKNGVFFPDCFILIFLSSVHRCPAIPATERPDSSHSNQHRTTQYEVSAVIT
jgi:hypothetical protein